MECFLKIGCDVPFIKLRKVDLDAEGGAISLTHFNIFDLGVLTECILEDLKFVECIRRKMEIFDSVNPASLRVLSVLNSRDPPLVRLLVIYREVELDKICQLLELHRHTSHLTHSVEHRCHTLVPQS